MSAAFPSSFFSKILHLLDEEEMDIYTMSLYRMDRQDMEFFKEEDRQRVEKIFDILQDDTKRHMDLLKLIVELGGA